MSFLGLDPFAHAHSMSLELYNVDTVSEDYRSSMGPLQRHEHIWYNNDRLLGLQITSDADLLSKDPVFETALNHFIVEPVM